MERRKFVIGLGALAAGGSAAVGSGAFSSAEVGREANIEVVDDSDGLIALDSDLESDIVTTETIGGGSDDPPEYLTIDFDVDEGGDGINPNSTYILGTPEARDWPGDSRTSNALGNFFEDNSYEEDHAFRITNQDTVAHDISLSIESEVDFSNGEVWVGLLTDDDEDDAWDNIDISIDNVGAGETVYAFIAVRSTGTYDTDPVKDFDITISAD